MPQAIFSSSKEVDASLVQKAIIAMMRLCLRLLPYKADISEPLLKGGWTCGAIWVMRACMCFEMR